MVLEHDLCATLPEHPGGRTHLNTFFRNVCFPKRWTTWRDKDNEQISITEQQAGRQAGRQAGSQAGRQAGLGYVRPRSNMASVSK